jgi:hypothetical protein
MRWRRVVANLMFSASAVSISTNHRATAAHGLSEDVATIGLILVIFSLARSGRADRAPAAVGAYIGAAYWTRVPSASLNPGCRRRRSPRAAHQRGAGCRRAATCAPMGSSVVRAVVVHVGSSGFTAGHAARTGRRVAGTPGSSTGGGVHVGSRRSAVGTPRTGGRTAFRHSAVMKRGEPVQGLVDLGGQIRAGDAGALAWAGNQVAQVSLPARRRRFPTGRLDVDHCSS